VNDRQRLTTSFLFLADLTLTQSDAVISSVADRMHLSKADILDSSSNSGASPAVKLALAETHVIQETKTFFLDQGIILDALIPPPSTSSSAPPPPQKRSQTTILVKNIPYGTTLATLEEMFGAHGELARVLMPPAGTLAIVEFVESHACRDAFRALAYKRMGNSVLYLEKGPEGMFDREKMGGGAGKPVVKGGVPIPQLSANATASTSTAATASTSQISPPNSTLFLKNLNFSTTTALLTTTFSHLPSFLFARVQTKPHPSKTNVQLSMGFGFVGFRDPESAKAAKETMDGFRLDGHVLEVKFAQRDPGEMEGVGGGKGEKGSVGKGTTCKMVVKNVPFEATKKDIRELFKCVSVSSLSCLLFPESHPLIAVMPLLLPLPLLPPSPSLQRLRSSQIRPTPPKVRHQSPRVRLPRVLLPPRRRGGHARSAPYPSPRPTLGARVGGGGDGH
jgi:multiple RNA-binding domain-containing protein 1